MFYSKFHCKLNYIKSFWAEVKWYSYLHCDYSFNHLKEVVPRALDSISITKIRRFSRRSARYMSAYELGLSGKAAVFAVKQYRSHLRVPETVLEEFGNM